MKEWSDKEWKDFFDRHTPTPQQRDRWFTRRVMNRLPSKRWSVEMWVSFGVTVAVMAVCAVLYWMVACDIIENDCWNCLSTWVSYGTLALVSLLGFVQLGSFLHRLYETT